MRIYNAACLQLESISGNASVVKAAERMKASNVGLLLVADGHNLIGVVTDRDIVVRAAAAGMALDKTPVRDIMSQPVVCVRGNAEISEAAALMTKSKIRRLVVTNNRDEPVGVLSLDDIAFSTHGDETVGWVLEEIAQGPRSSALFRTG